MRTKIYMIDGSDELNKYDMKDIEKLNAEWLVYWYEVGSYEGSGFSIWKNGDTYYYHDMGHCSCYGPTSEMDNTGGYKRLGDIAKFADRYNNGEKIISFIKERGLE